MHSLEGFTYISAFLPQGEHDALLERVHSLHFAHDRFRGQVLKRSYAQFGWQYVSAGRKVVPAPPLPDYLAEIVQQAMPHCQGTALFEQCIVTRYAQGSGTGWHRDADCFGDTILAISLGVSAKLRLRPIGYLKHSHEVLVAPGSLYVMRGPARWTFEHQVVPIKADRYSLTFRSVAAARHQ